MRKTITGCAGFYVKENGNCEVLGKKPTVKNCKKCNFSCIKREV